MDVPRLPPWRNAMKKTVLIICFILLSIVSAYVGYMVAGLLGIFAWLCVFAFIAIEIVYHFGAKGSLLRGFKSNTSSEVPDARNEQTTRTARGFYDLDYRGRGRN
jgi:hypothetical protein